MSIQQENKRLKDEKSRLEARDRYNDGPHTPGSKNTLTQKSADVKKRKKKKQEKKSGGEFARRPGGQRRHKGYAHKYEKADETRHITMNKCNKKDCRCKELKVTRVETVYAEEITKPQARTVKYIVSYYDCLGCGNTDMRSDYPLLKNGRFGPNVVMEVLLNYLSRHAKQDERRQTSAVGRTLDGVWGGRKHPQEGVDDRLIPPANVIIQHMQRARILHVDETSISLNGKLVWVWTFFEPGSGKVLFVIRKSRGQDVPREILGDNWSGTLIVDGWKMYARYVVQRCTAHPIREGRDITEKDPDDEDAARALRMFQKILRDAKKKIQNSGVESSFAKYEIYRLFTTNL